jgi:hypothetical protein
MQKAVSLDEAMIEQWNSDLEARCHAGAIGILKQISDKERPQVDVQQTIALVR